METVHAQDDVKHMNQMMLYSKIVTIRTSAQFGVAYSTSPSIVLLRSALFYVLFAVLLHHFPFGTMHRNPRETKFTKVRSNPPSGSRVMAEKPLTRG